MDKVIKIATDCLERPWPDLTIILDVDAGIGLRRLNRDFDRMEQKGGEYHQKVREGFLQLANEHENFVVVDGATDIEAVHEEIKRVVGKTNF